MTVDSGMGEYLLLILGTALVNNVVLVKFLGLCSFMGVSNKIDSALGMGLATTFVHVLSVKNKHKNSFGRFKFIDIIFSRVFGFLRSFSLIT